MELLQKHQSLQQPLFSMSRSGSRASAGFRPREGMAGDIQDASLGDARAGQLSGFQIMIPCLTAAINGRSAVISACHCPCLRV